MLSDTVPAILNVAADPDDRSFLIGTTEWGANGQWRGEIRVIDLATGKTRTWTAPVHDGHYFIPGPPSWADGDRLLAFT